MILDHEWLVALAELTEHSPGIVSSVIGIVVYALIRDGLPRYKRWRVERNNPPSSNPGNSGLTQRIAACETDIKKISDSCTRTETLWEGQKGFNERMEGHIKNFYKKFDQLAGLGKG